MHSKVNLRCDLWIVIYSKMHSCTVNLVSWNRGNIFFFSQDYVKENTYNYILLSYLLSSFTLQKFFCVWNINFKCLWKRKYSQWLIEPNNMIRSTTVEYNVYNNIFSWWPNYHVILSSKFYSKHLNSQINFMFTPQ